MSTPRPTPRTWYLVGAGLIVSAVTMAIIAFGQMISTIEGMQRVVVPAGAAPAKLKITLPAGTSTLYAEQRAVVGGTAVAVSGPFKYRCGIEEAARDGSAIGFATAGGKVTYGIGDFAGHDAYDVSVPEAGSYTLVCQSEQTFAMAVGRGVGSPIVVAVIGLVPFTLGLATILIVLFRRRRQLRGA